MQLPRFNNLAKSVHLRHFGHLTEEFLSLPHHRYIIGAHWTMVPQQYPSSVRLSSETMTMQLVMSIEPLLNLTEKTIQSC